MEQTGWANFDNFESTLNIANKTDPEPFQANFSDMFKTPVQNSIEESSPLSVTNTNLNDSDGSGDKKSIKPAETNLTQLWEMNFAKENITCVDSVNTPDSNANPVTISR